MSVAYVSPFTNNTNEYINRVKVVTQACGFVVEPLSFKILLSRKVFGLLDPSNVVLVHWMESRIFTEGRSQPKINLAGVIQFSIYVFVFCLMRAKLIYFMHDHAAHDVSGWKKSLSIAAIRLLASLASVRVVHDPSYCKTYGARYLPHPLYVDEVPLRPRGTDRLPESFLAGVLGALRPYKRLEHLIDAWPDGVRLRMRGRADQAYNNLLQERIRKRQLANYVTLQTGFMSREEFDLELARLDAIILPHADESALVSGAFFEAIGATPFVIARSSPFTKWAATKFQGIYTFEDGPQLAAAIKSAQNLSSKSNAILEENAKIANELFGMASCIRLYKQAFEDARLKHPPLTY